MTLIYEIIEMEIKIFVKSCEFTFYYGDISIKWLQHESHLVTI